MIGVSIPVEEVARLLWHNACYDGESFFVMVPTRDFLKYEAVNRGDDEHVIAFEQRITEALKSHYGESTE